MLFSVRYIIIRWRLSMAEIELVKIRAKIQIGNNLEVETPYIQSFNVRKARGESSTFDASLKVKHEHIEKSSLNGEVLIHAGRDVPKLIFTGIVKKASISPCWDDPGYVFMNISGADASSLLQGKKFTRRCRATKGTWVSIESVARPGLRDGKFAYDLNTVQLDSGMAHNQIMQHMPNHKQGKKTSKPPKSKTPTPVLARIVAFLKNLVDGDDDE